MRILTLLAQIDIPDSAGEVVDTVKANPALLRLLIGVGIITVGLFFWGIAKQAIKAMLVGGVLSVLVSFWYFNIR